MKRMMCLCAGLAVLSTAASPASAQTWKDDLIDQIEEAFDDSNDGGGATMSRGRLPAPLTDADFFGDASRVELGRLLFYDKILSGNMNISCATCHHGLAGTGDMLSLPVGEGGFGLGPARDAGFEETLIHERVPRNAPPVFNLGAREITVMFHDGRVEVDPSQPSGFLSPAGDDLPHGFEHVLEVQAMFPVTSGAEMAGQAGENPIADAAAAGDLPMVWDLLAARLQEIPEYVAMFIDAFDDVSAASDITYAHAAKALAAFEAVTWRFDDSPFDRYLRRDRSSMSQRARRGMRLFYGRAGCADCHSGVLQTDQNYYAIGMPQIGPGKGDNLPGFDDGLDDFGRERVTGDISDRFRFRTPTLRNVALSGPWGHSGAYDTLEGVIRHHLDPVAALSSWDVDEAVLPSAPHLEETDFACFEDSTRRAAIAAAVELTPKNLSDKDVDELVEFLHALTDLRAVTDLRRDVPNTVPSGLPVGD